MANTLSATFALTGSGTLTKNVLDSLPVDSVTIGSNGFPTLSDSISDGTTSIETCNEWFHDQRTVAGPGTDNLDFNGGVLSNQLGQAIVLTSIKVFLLAIVSPDGVKSLQVGPQGLANAFQGWEGGVAAGNYETVFDKVYRTNLSAAALGWTVNGTHKIVGITNPGGTSVVYEIWVLGTK